MRHSFLRSSVLPFMVCSFRDGSRAGPQELAVHVWFGQQAAGYYSLFSSHRGKRARDCFIGKIGTVTVVIAMILLWISSSTISYLDRSIHINHVQIINRSVRSLCRY